MSSNEKPQLRVYTLVPREDEAPFWLHIGWAYHNKDGNGMTVRLQALPLTEKLVIREYRPDESEGSEQATRGAISAQASPRSRKSNKGTAPADASS